MGGKRPFRSIAPFIRFGSDLTRSPCGAGASAICAKRTIPLRLRISPAQRAYRSRRRRRSEDIRPSMDLCSVEILVAE
jgi:hypothetical protein